ncbi:unnamed protein product [Gadus morhua 'NCC']
MTEPDTFERADQSRRRGQVDAWPQGDEGGGGGEAIPSLQPIICLRHMGIIFCAVLIMSSLNIVNRLAAVDIGDNEQHGWMLYWLQGMRIGNHSEITSGHVHTHAHTHTHLHKYRLLSDRDKNSSPPGS